MDTLFQERFPGWDVEHAAIMETSVMLHLRPELMLFERAVDDASARHPWYGVLPVPKDFVPESGALWKATQASTEKGAVAWEEIVAQFRKAVATEPGQAEASRPHQRRRLRSRPRLCLLGAAKPKINIVQARIALGPMKIMLSLR